MNFSELTRQRQSCRAFDPDRPVPREAVTACLEAARLAPSACNAQPYHFTVVQGDLAGQVGALTRSMGMNGFTAGVPVFIVVSEAPYNPTAAVGARLKAQDYRSVDIGITAAYLTAQAADLGLATCILGWFDEDKVRQCTSAQGRVRLVIALGYAREGDPIRPKRRKPLEDLVTWAEPGQS